MNFTEQECVYLQLALKQAIDTLKSSLATRSVEERAQLRLILVKWEFLRDMTIKLVGDVKQITQ